METIKQWVTSCPDWESRIINQESLIPCPPLNKKVADIALGIFKELTLVDVTGKPKIGEVCKEWVFNFVAAIFGAYDPETKERLIKEFFLLIAKKNSKSTISAGIMLTALILNERHSAQFVIISPTKETSESSYRPIADMIKADEELLSIFNISDHTKTITHIGTKATLKVLAFDANTVTGLKATGILVDELHLLGNKAQADTILREAKGGMLSRPEGFCIYLTTQSSGTPQGIFKNILDYARNVRNARITDDKFLPVIYEYPDSYINDNKHLDPNTWYIPNPNNGASLQIKDLVSQYEQIKDNEASVQDFLSKHLNIQQTINLKANRWQALTELLPNNEAEVTLKEILNKCEVLCIGFDGAALFDLAALTVTGRIANTNKYLSWSHGWLNASALEKNKRSAEKLKELANLKEITIVNDVSEQFKDITDTVLMVYKTNKLYKIGVDPYAVGTFITDLEALGIPEDRIIGINQGFKMQQHIITLENLLARNAITFSKQELIRWQASNARLVQKSNAVMVSKADSADKIDNIISILNSIALISQNPAAMTPKKTSIFLI